MKRFKKLGQYFLKDKKILRRISESLEITKEDLVIEIGGGHGELTQFLLPAKKVIVFEIDPFLAEILRKKFNHYSQVEIKEGDVLKFPFYQMAPDYKLIGNIPYYLSGQIIRLLINSTKRPKIAVLTFQKEFAEKLLGLPHQNFLSVLLKLITGRIEKVAYISKNLFRPPPQVDSLALKFIFNQKSVSDCFVRFLKILFSSPRKKISNNLKNSIFKKKLQEISPEILNLRAHQLSLDQILQLFEKLI